MILQKYILFYKKNEFICFFLKNNNSFTNNIFEIPGIQFKTIKSQLIQ